MKMKKLTMAALLLVLCLLLSGCRTRTRLSGPAMPDDAGEQASDSLAGSLPEDIPDGEKDPDKQEKNGESRGQTKENPEASRKEYDENRPAEILPGTERTVHESGEGSGFSGSGENPDQSAAKLNPSAERSAVRTVAAGEAEQKGVSEEAEQADSAFSYYTVLLQDRMGSLFECKRMNVYWETPEDHLTVFKTSPEHALILEAGAYDVSARLLEGNLRVDDGWIGRKNPDIIVKAVSRKVLGTGVSSSAAARKVYTELLAREGWSALGAVKNGRILLLSEELLEAPHLRLAAALMIARTASPDLFADVSIGDALAMLGEEAAGTAPDGIFYYTGQGGF